MPENAIITDDYIQGEYRADIGWAILRGSMRSLKKPEFLAKATAANAADTLLIAAKGALAALSQHHTHPADIAAAKKWLADAIADATPTP